MRPLLVSLLLVTVALAGCADSEPEPRTPMPAPSFPVPDQGEPEPEPEEEPDLPPQAAIQVNGNSLAQTLQLQGAQDVRFDGLSSSDPEGEPLQYAWTHNGTAAGSDASWTATLGIGTHDVTLVVADPAGQEASATVQVIISELPPPPEPIVYFFDDAESDANWTTSSHVSLDLLGGVGPVPPNVDLEDVPHLNDWHHTTAQAQSGNQSWTMIAEAPDPELSGTAEGYADMAHVLMTSPAIGLNGTSAIWSFVLAGDVEPAVHEGLYVRIAGEDGEWATLEQIVGPVDQWTTYRHDLSAYLGQTVTLQFLFRSDATCSSTTPIPQGELAGGEALCAGESDGTYLGYYLDDILVSEAG